MISETRCSFCGQPYASGYCHFCNLSASEIQCTELGCARLSSPGDDVCAVCAVLASVRDVFTTPIETVEPARVGGYLLIGRAQDVDIYMYRGQLLTHDPGDLPYTWEAIGGCFVSAEDAMLMIDEWTSNQ